MNARLYVLGRTILQGDVSMNSRLFINGDVSMNSRLFITSDVSMNARLYVLGRTINQGDVSMNSRLFVNGDVSMNSRLFVNSDVSMNARLFVSGDVSMNARLYVKKDTIIDGNIYLQSTSHVYVGDKEIGASTATDTNDIWTLTNLIRAPPAVTFVSGIDPLSTTITFAWTYPTQINTGISQYPLPLINKLSIQLSYYNGSTITGPTNILDNVTGTYYINTSIVSSTSTAITAVVITNSSNLTTGYGTVSVSGSTRYGYTYYDSGLVNLASSTSNSLTVWYSNYNTTPQKNSITFTNFLTSGTPGQVQNLSFTVNSNSSNPITITFQYYPPQYSDSNTGTLTLTSSNAPIKDYKITYSTAGSTYRYNGQISTSGSTTVTANSTNPGSADTTNFYNLFPESTYTFNIVASNKTTNTSYGTSFATANVTTTNLNPRTFETSITFPTTNYTKATATLVYTGLSPTNVYFIGGTIVDWTSDYFNSPINSYNTRGNLGIGTNASLSVSATLGTNAGSVTYQGFPVSKPSDFTSGGLTITTSTPKDTYSTYSTGHQGFYLDTSNNITIKAAALIPSSSQYTLTVTQTQAGGSTSPFNFNYYLDTTASLSVTSFTTGLHTSTQSIQICGIWITYGTVKLTATTTVNNLGNYFFNSSKILQYSGTYVSISNETGIGNVTTTKATTLVSPTTVTNSGTAISYTNTSYATQIGSITVTAYNPVNTIASNTSAAISAILDQPSYNLYSTFKTSASAAIISTSVTTGYRVYSGITQAGTSVPNYLNGGTTAYSTIAFDNTWSLINNNNTGGYDGTQELLIANGAFRTSDTNYAINYANYKYVTGGSVNSGSGQFNYSTISSSGYRYVTFAWKVDTALSGSNGYLNISLSGNNLNVVNTLLYANSGGTNKILIYYRVEDTDALITFTSNNSSTYWVNANENATDPLTNNGSVSASNYFTVPANKYPYYSSPTITQPATTIIKTALPFPLSTSTTGLTSGKIYIYVRIGLPMNIANVYLTNVQAYLSSS